MAPPWNLEPRNAEPEGVYGFTCNKKCCIEGRRVEEGGVNHGIKYVKAKCKLASVVHTTPLAFGGIASCNCSNLEVPFRFDSWTCIASYTTAVTLPPGLRLYGFTWTRYFTSCSSHLCVCVNISHQINTKVKTERDTPANTHAVWRLCHLGPSLVPNRLCVLYIYSSHKVGP